MNQVALPTQTEQLAHFTKRSPSEAAVTHSVKNFPRLYTSPKFRICVQSSSPIVPTEVETLPPCTFTVHFNTNISCQQTALF